jgi:hypothetical protein
MVGAALVMVALSAAASPGLQSDRFQAAVACPNTGELVIDKIKICYFTCPDVRTTIRIGADQICPPFH